MIRGHVSKFMGYPDWWPDKSRNRKGVANSSRVLSTYSPTTTHDRNKSASVRANFLSNRSGGVVNNSDATANNGTDSPLANFKLEQVQILLNMINQKQQDKMIGEYFSLY